MLNIHRLASRSDDKPGHNETTMALLVALAMIVFIGFLCLAALYFLRKMRLAAKKGQDSQLPLYEKRQSGHRRLTITALPYGKGRDSVVVYSEKQDLLSNNSSPPASPVPEIRITFPDEVDEAGRPQSGRVVVVRVGEHSVGLEPLQDDLPAYQRDASDRFDSLDLDRIGGLKEKDSKDYA